MDSEQEGREKKKGAVPARPPRRRGARKRTGLLLSSTAPAQCPIACCPKKLSRCCYDYQTVRVLVSARQCFPLTTNQYQPGLSVQKLTSEAVLLLTMSKKNAIVGPDADTKE